MPAFTELFKSFISQFITLFAEMAPYLLLGFLLAGILHVWVPNKLYIPKISKPNFKSVLWAALFGVPLPICSCGVIPTAIALRREGASKGASVSFLISTPATGVDSILATYSLLGGPFAILRPIAAFFTSLLGGVFTNLFTKNESSANLIESAEVENHGHSSCCAEHDSCSEHSTTSSVPKRTFGQKILATLEYGFVDMAANVSKWLTIGLLLGALIAAFVPDNFFLFLHDYPILCMLAVLLLAMPMYTCATGSIPLALTLVSKGITPGAALVLLMAGPATSIASMLVVGKAFGKKTLFAYIASIAVGALFFGFIIDTFFMDTFLTSMLHKVGAECHGHGGLGIFDYTCAGLLAVFMIYSKFFHKDSCNDSHCGCNEKSCEKSNCECNEHSCENVSTNCCEKDCNDDPATNAQTSKIKTYRVNGMSCSHCKECVEKAVRILDGVESAFASVSEKSLTIEGSVDENALKVAVEEAGFKFGGKI